MIDIFDLILCGFRRNELGEMSIVEFNENVEIMRIKQSMGMLESKGLPRIKRRE